MFKLLLKIQISYLLGSFYENPKITSITHLIFLNVGSTRLESEKKKESKVYYKYMAKVNF